MQDCNRDWFWQALGLYKRQSRAEEKRRRRRKSHERQRTKKTQGRKKSKQTEKQRRKKLRRPTTQKNKKKETEKQRRKQQQSGNPPSPSSSSSPSPRSCTSPNRSFTPQLQSSIFSRNGTRNGAFQEKITVETKTKWSGRSRGKKNETGGQKQSKRSKYTEKRRKEK